MIHAYASLAHYAAHLKPILDAIPEWERGLLWAPREGCPWGPPVDPAFDAGGNDPVLVAGLSDMQHWETRRPLVYVEHGAGQTYVGIEDHGSYSGGSHRGFDVRLYLSPSQTVADRWRARGAEAVAVGCPRLDQHANRRRSPAWNNPSPVVAFTWHWKCFPEGTLVGGPPATAAGSRVHEGEMVVLRTASGNELTGTPNHPVLTSRGWVALGDLHEGDQVVKYAGDESVGADGPHDVQVPSRVEDVARSFDESGAMVSVRVPVTAHDFHGDGADGQIAIVRADRRLLPDLVACGAEPVGQPVLVLPDLDGALLTGAGAPGKVFGGLLDTANRSVGGGCAGAAFVERGLRGGQPGRVARGAGESGVLDDPVSAGRPDASDAAGLLDRLAGHVELDQVVGVTRSGGHKLTVYSLTTGEGWYTANGLVVSNCTLLPETYTAWPAYELALPSVVEKLRADGVQVIGHAHPRHAAPMRDWYQAHGIPYLDDLDETLRFADVLVADNTSALPEAAAVGLPLVWLNCDDYRRDVEHGGRFWSWPRGQVQVDHPDDLHDAVLRAIADPPDVALARRAMVEGIYSTPVGNAALAAAEAVLRAFSPEG